MSATEELESPFLSLELESVGELAEQEGGGARAPIQILDENDRPISDGTYVAEQGRVSREGKLDANGRADLGDIDPAQPFLFGIKDRVCAIQYGAFFNPDDPGNQYGGTWFDWTLVSTDSMPKTSFWPHYQRELAKPGAEPATFARRGPPPATVDRFWQHEHITRRRIRVATPLLRSTGEVKIRAIPPPIRVGPFVRYADHERALIWIETVTPCLARARYRRSGTTAESVSHASTVRVGGRHFAFLELTGLAEDEFHDYTLDLAPLPISGPIPVDEDAVKRAFPPLTKVVQDAMTAMLKGISLSGNEWLSFRTLRRVYDVQLRFATGSCRWYPGDTKTEVNEEGKKETKAWSSDMLNALGEWLKKTPRDLWPHFLFFSGDQIYADEIGDDHGQKLAASRFAARIPGPTDHTGAVRDKLIDGAWAGRFAHRYLAYTPPTAAIRKRIGDDLEKLAQLYRDNPDIRDIYRAYPDSDPEKKLRELYETFKNKRELSGKTSGEDDDEAKARKAVQELSNVRLLETRAGTFRGRYLHWTAATDEVRRRNPMRYRLLLHNFLLWQLPDFESQLPTVTPNELMVAPMKPNRQPHPLAADGVHAADFAEYAYLYERAWTSLAPVRVLLAHVPTFLIFDDHEVTDDWNFDVTWVRLLHNAKDGYKLWPKTLTDALAAYFVYQGYGNKAPSKWNKDDPRVVALREAQELGNDALPALRRFINRACFPAPDAKASRKDPRVFYQSGLTLDWHYKLPFDPPFLVPDCRSRKRLVQGDDEIRIIDHDGASKPTSQTIDDAQLAWIQESLAKWSGPTVFIGASVPFLLPKKPMDFMRRPETAASAWARGKAVLSLFAVLFNSTTLGMAGQSLLRVFRRAKDLEHPVRDKTWRDLWGIVAGLQAAGSKIKTVVLVSGDVHHSYAMSARLPGEGAPKPELLQITCSGLQTTIRGGAKEWIAGKLLGSELPFDVGKYTMVPGFFRKVGTGSEELILYDNAVALVSAVFKEEATVRVDFLSWSDDYVFKYTGGPLGQPAKQRELAAAESVAP